jgi:hypothetical protein
VACLTGTGHFSRSFAVPTYEQTDEEKRADERTKENGGKGQWRRTRRTADEKDDGREGDLTAKESGEG